MAIQCARLIIIILVIGILEIFFFIPAKTAEIRHYENQRPIIGILTQELSHHLNNVYPNYDSYIAASYVKFIESGGARVVPIWIGQSENYYEEILGKINGVLFPGGSTFFNRSNGYADAGRTIYRIAERMNNGSDYFPIWGICLGFELLTFAAADGREHRSHCRSHNQPLPLNFQPNQLKKSKMFGNASNEIVEILKSENVTINFHRYCITKKDLKKVHIDDKFRVISVNKDWNGMEFISTIEHSNVNIPFYGLQFHPEKNNFEWATRFDTPHSPNAILVSQFFANKIVNEARKNFHNFSSPQEEERHLIYNYNVFYTGPTQSSFEQCYLFKNKNIN